MNYASLIEGIAVRYRQPHLDVFEFFLERASILEFEAGMMRDEAERIAVDETEAFFRSKRL